MFKKTSLLAPFIFLSLGMSACSSTATLTNKVQPNKIEVIPVVYEKRSPKPRRIVRTRKRSSYRGSFANKLSNAALGRLRSNVTYNGSYVKIAYPWGDVPSNIGVCTDVVIRSYRRLGIDLQKQVHQDMSSAFSSYPNIKKWGLSRPDTNIDHRRVYNLRAFFTRRGAGLPITRNPRDYKAGDLVTWMVGPGLPHIGVVVNRPSKADPRRKMIVHNIARGPQMEDVLFRFPITGHYRYTPKHINNKPKTLYASRKSQSNSSQINYNQLVEAANILSRIPATAKRKKQNKVNVANSSSKTSDKALQLATLDKNAIKELLTR